MNYNYENKTTLLFYIFFILGLQEQRKMPEKWQPCAR